MNLATSAWTAWTGGWAARAGMAVVVAVGLAACGSETKTPSAGSGTATLAVTSYPAARAFVDGVDKGTTPVAAMTVAPGAHTIVLHADGFSEHSEVVQVKAGDKPTTVDAVLVVKNPDDPASHALLAQAAEIPMEPAETASTHRGAGPDMVVMFPAGEIRKAGLSTYRVEIDAKFEGTGNLEFRQGKKVLWTKPFQPDNLVTMGAVPKEVLDAVGSGDVVTWGFFPSDAKQKAVTSRFKVIEKKQADAKLAKIDADPRLAKQPALVRDLLKADSLQNYSLFTEALLGYLDIGTKHPDTSLPHKGIVNCLQRLHLTESRLYVDALAKKPSEKSPMQPARIGGGEGLGGVDTPDVEMTMPGPTPVPAMADPAMGDTPAPVAAMDPEPGPDPTPVPVLVPAERDHQARLLAMASSEARMKADEAALRAQAAQEAARNAATAANDTRVAADAAKGEAEAAKQAFDAAADGSPEKAAAEAALRASLEKVQAAEDAARAAQEEVLAAQQSASRAEAEVRRMEDQAKKAAEAAAALPADATAPGPIVEPGLPVAGDAQKVEGFAQVAADAAKRANDAVAAIPGKLAGVTQIFQQAEQARVDAEAAVEKAATTGDPADVAASEDAMKKAADLEQKAAEARAALGDPSMADRLKEAVATASFAQRAADLAARLASKNPGDPRALRAAEEAAKKAEEAARKVEEILAGIPTGG